MIGWPVLRALLIVSCATLFSVCADEPQPVMSSPVAPATAVTGSPGLSGASSAGASSAVRAHRILLVVSDACSGCGAALQKLEAAGGAFELLRRRGWKIGAGADQHIQIVHQSQVVDADIADLVADLKVNSGPVVVGIENGQIQRSFHHGCTTPLDPWTFGWLMTGNDERPREFHPEPIQVATTGNYPLRGNHWSVDGNWSPGRESVIQHLRSVHGNQLQAAWNLDSWSLEELRSVHDDLHDREEGFRGRYNGSQSASRSGAGSPGGFRKPGKADR